MILGAHHTPLSLPLVSEWPPVPRASPGTQDLDVPQSGVMILASGSYHKLMARNGATITFSGGIYTFSDWDIREGVSLYVGAPTEIRITGKLKVDSKVFLGASPIGTGLSARDIVVFVMGTDDGPANAPGKAADLAAKTTIRAYVDVPNGTLQLGPKSIATGALTAKWIILGEQVELGLENQ